jgi:hypothetical protein
LKIFSAERFLLKKLPAGLKKKMRGKYAGVRWIYFFFAAGAFSSFFAGFLAGTSFYLGILHLY